MFEKQIQMVDLRGQYERLRNEIDPVSYTHLTLPTTSRV